MKKIASLAVAAAIVATTAIVAAPAAQAGPFFHSHHHGFWGGPYAGGVTIVAGSPIIGGCYSVKRKVFVPGYGVVVRRSTVCG